MFELIKYFSRCIVISDFYLFLKDKILWKPYWKQNLWKWIVTCYNHLNTTSICYMLYYKIPKPLKSIFLTWYLFSCCCFSSIEDFNGKSLTFFSMSLTQCDILSYWSSYFAHCLMARSRLSRRVFTDVEYVSQSIFSMSISCCMACLPWRAVVSLALAPQFSDCFILEAPSGKRASNSCTNVNTFLYLLPLIF